MQTVAACKALTPRKAIAPPLYERKAQVEADLPSGVRLDALDLQILRLLHGDARLSFRELAERLDSTTPTISARVKALEDVGILRGYHAALDHAVLGGASYVVSASVQPQHAMRAHAAIAALPGAHQAFLLAGGRVVAHVHLRAPVQTLAQLHERLAEIPGLQTYEANEVIHAAQSDALEDLPENVDVACHQCKGPIHGDPVKGKFGDRTHVFCCRHCLATFRDRFQLLQIRSGKQRPA